MKNSKLVFTITVFFVVCCFMATGSWAARKHDISHANARGFINQLNQNGANLGKALGLSHEDGFQLLRKITDLNGETHYRYQQTFKNFPVWGMQTVVSKRGDRVTKLTGNFVQGSRGDIGNIPVSLDSRRALRQMQDLHKAKDDAAVWNFRNEQAGTFVYFHKKSQKARLCYIVSFFADNECGNPSRPILFIDAKNGKIIDSFDALTYAYEGVGPGGNEKVGYYYYGTDFTPFGVAVSGSTCTMDWDDCRSVNLNHGTSGSTPYSYTCYENLFKEINGAYSPINDAQFFGQTVYNMYMAWYGVPVLPFQLMMRVHYSTNYENAFWDGSSMTFGDGYTTFYPLVSLDVSAHEVAHGFTENHSGLIYSSQSGGINEAYSDMAGEAAKYYMRGTNDFMCGFDIYKNPTQALRYLCNPPQDGISIDHINDYYEGMDVHYSSGIFNKAFCLIAQSSGWTTRMAFDIFTRANMVYWTPSCTFQQGAEDAMNAAVDLGYPCQDVVNAFAVVGINLVCPGPPVADFSANPLSGGVPFTTQFTDLSQAPTSWSWNFGDGNTSTEQNPSHTYTSMGTFTVSLTATNQFGSDTMTKTDYITVTAPQPPIADFVADNTDVNIGNIVNFTDLSLENPTSWSWTFAGGTPGTSTLQNPSIQYNTVGTFDVTLVATNAQGSDTMTKVGYISVSVKPYCTSSGNSQSYEYIAGVAVADLNNASGASPYSDFTGLTASMTQGQTVSVSLTPGFVSGAYTENWKIWIDWNDDHDFEDAGEEVFAGSGSTVVSGSFTVPTATIIGDTRMRVSMSYSTYPPICGTFTYGEVEDYTANISGGGNIPPTADFTFTTTDLTADFTDASSDADGTIVGWDWDFGDGNTSTAQNPSHTYAAAGTYNVTLTVTDNDSATDSVTKPVTVTAPNQAPTADFTFTTDCLTANFTDASSDPDGTIVGWDWDFGDGNTSTSQNPSHTYAADGTYTVTLTVTDDDSATGTISKSVTVTDCPGSITLTANGYKTKGVKYVDLTWSGAVGADVNIFRDGQLIATVANSGSFTDNLGKGKGGTYTYQVCETDGSVCSNTASVTF
jgi:PKD repeat protein